MTGRDSDEDWFVERGSSLGEKRRRRLGTSMDD
jgi:hypothetical protein